MTNKNIQYLKYYLKSLPRMTTDEGSLPTVIVNGKQNNVV